MSHAGLTQNPNPGWQDKVIENRSGKKPRYAKYPMFTEVGLPLMAIFDLLDTDSGIPAVTVFVVDATNEFEVKVDIRVDTVSPELALAIADILRHFAYTGKLH